MLLLSVAHIHPEAYLAVDACDQCVHHLPHAGHLTAGSGAAHDCLLCQFLSISYVAVAVATVVFFTDFRKIHFAAPQTAVLLAARGRVGLRAPPSLFL